MKTLMELLFILLFIGFVDLFIYRICEGIEEYAEALSEERKRRTISRLLP